jgi:hypothetical protein
MTPGTPVRVSGARIVCGQPLSERSQNTASRCQTSELPDTVVLANSI